MIEIEIDPEDINQDFTTQDLLEADSKCTTLSDFKMSNLLLSAKGVIDYGENILSQLPSLDRIRGREIVNLMKRCQDNKKMEKMETVQSQLLEAYTESSIAMKPLIMWTYRKIRECRVLITDAERKLQDQIKIKNLSMEKPDGDKTKYLEVPVFSGDVNTSHL